MKVHYPVNRYADYFKFAFVRNPWDRLVSCWTNKVLDRGTPKAKGVVRWRPDHFMESAAPSDFSDFVDYVSTLDVERCDLHLRLQCSLVDVNSIDYLGRFESFETDLAAVFGRIGIPVLEIGRQNPSVNRRPYRDYYTAELRDKVARIYRRDIQIFGYTY